MSSHARKTKCLPDHPQSFSTRRFARFIALAMLLLPGAAYSSNVDITVTGTLASGTDVTGIFGPAGANLTGDSYTLVSTFDTTKGSQTTTNCSGVPCSSEIAGSSGGASDPLVSSVLTIGGGSWSFGSYPSNYYDNETDREIPTAGSRIYVDLDYHYSTDVSSGDDAVSANAQPSGSSWTTNYSWQGAYTNSSLSGLTENFSIDRVLYSTPTLTQEAYGTLIASTVSVSGPYTPGSTTPPAATTNKPKNNGCQTCTNGSNPAVPNSTPSGSAPATIPGASTANGANTPVPNGSAPNGYNITPFIPTSSQKSTGSVNTATGNNVQLDTDYAGAPEQQLGMTRVYNSFNPVASSFGAGWTGTWNRTITGPVSSVVSVTHQDGRVDTYTQSGTNWIADANVTDVLTEIMSGGVQTGWNLFRSDDTTEIYNMSGLLTSVISRSGLVTTLTYTSGNLTTVTGPFGQTLTFTYDASNRVATMTTPNTDVYTYLYDTRGNLAAVYYPDTTVKSYVYGNTTYTHLLTGIQDQLGNMYASFTYDGTGRVTSTQHAGGADVTNFTYNTGGTVTATDANSNAHTYTYSTQFNLVQPSALSGTPYPTAGGAAFTYDTNGFIASRTDFDGNVTHYVHNVKGEETSRTEAYGTTLARTITTTWHATFHLPLTITEPNRVTTFTYDAHGMMLTKTITAGTKTREWIYTYNANGQVLTAEDPDTNVTTFTYDTHGNVATIKDALLHVTNFTSYDSNGRLLSATDPNGLTYTMTYDTLGRMLTRKIGTFTTTYTYDVAGDLTKAQMPDGSKLTYTYDAAHRLTKVTDYDGNYKTYTLDAAGNRTAVKVYDSSNNLKLSHTYTYDAVERLATDVGAYTGESTAYAYDNQSNLLSITDPLSHATTYTYDALNRRKTSADALGHTTTYGYNANDDLTTVLDPRSLTTTYTYDGLDNQTAVSSPDTGSTSRTFDNAGNVLTSTDARSDVTTYTYDALQRPKTVAYTSGTGITYTYDAGTYGIGHLTSMTDATGSTTWTYDVLGHVLTKAQTVGTVVLTTTYAYSSSYNNLTSLTLPSGKYEDFYYDDEGRVKEIYTSAGSYPVYAATYVPFSNATMWQQTSDLWYSRTFDLDNRITADALSTVNTQTPSYDIASRLTGLTETGLSNKTYGYDNANRLTSFVNGSATTTYAYDADDNRSSVVTSAGTVTYNYPTTSNHLNSLSGLVSQTNSFDTSGNQTGDGTHTWSYNARGRMSQVVASSVTTTYGINGLGQRTTKASTAISGGSNIYVYDEAGHMIGEYGSTGTPIQETIWFGDTPTGVLMGSGGTGYDISPDWQNTPHLVTNSSGTLAWTWDRYAFGDHAPNTNPAGLGTFTYNPRFAGQMADTESGLNYNLNRDYNPTAGRYIESDPIGLGAGINTYGYVHAQPTMFVDRGGLDPWNDVKNFYGDFTSDPVGTMDKLSDLAPFMREVQIFNQLSSLATLGGGFTGLESATGTPTAGGFCESVDDLLANSTLTDSSSDLLNYARNGGGGYSQASKDFSSIVGDSPISEYPGGKMSAPYGGGSIGVRPSSTGGAPTIQINTPDAPTIKVRY